MVYHARIMNESHSNYFHIGKQISHALLLFGCATLVCHSQKGHFDQKNLCKVEKLYQMVTLMQVIYMQLFLHTVHLPLLHFFVVEEKSYHFLPLCPLLYGPLQFAHTCLLSL